VGSVWSVHVVVDPPVLDEHLRLEQAVEAPAVEVFVAQSSVEQLDPGVLPGRAGVDEDRADTVEPAPVSHRVGDKLRTVVEPHEGRGTPFDDQAVQGGHDPVRIDGALDHDGRALPGELVDDVEQLESAVVLGRVELEVERPQGVSGDEAHCADRDANAPHGLLAFAIGDLESLVTPKALDTLVIDPPAVTMEGLGGSAPTPPRALLGEVTQERPESLFVVRSCRCTQALGGAMLADHVTCFALGDPEPLLQPVDCNAATVRG
jgi:hypothetical protein